MSGIDIDIIILGVMALVAIIALIWETTTKR
jgi:hypothetical protein